VDSRYYLLFSSPLFSLLLDSISFLLARYDLDAEDFSTDTKNYTLKCWRIEDFRKVPQPEKVSVNLISVYALLSHIFRIMEYFIREIHILFTFSLIMAKVSFRLLISGWVEIQLRMREVYS
jgi:hypothetical protein